MAFLGHFIEREGIEVDLEKMIAMIEWPKLANLGELRVSYGLQGIITVS